MSIKFSAQLLSATTSKSRRKGSLQATSPFHQLKVLLWRGYIKTVRDSVSFFFITKSLFFSPGKKLLMYVNFQTLTHLRIIVSILTGLMLGAVFAETGNRGSTVLENYNLLFAILMHHMMTTMMLTILTCKLQSSPPVGIDRRYRKVYEKFCRSSIILIDRYSFQSLQR